MIYSAIRSWLIANGFEKDAQKVQERYIGISDLGEEKDRPRIALNAKNRDIFEDAVANQVSDDYLEEQRKKAGRNSSQRKLIEAVIACRKYVSKLAKEAGAFTGEQAKQLFRLSDYLRDNVRVAYMDVASGRWGVGYRFLPRPYGTGLRRTEKVSLRRLEDSRDRLPK